MNSVTIFTSFFFWYMCRVIFFKAIIVFSLFPSHIFVTRDETNQAMNILGKSTHMKNIEQCVLCVEQIGLILQYVTNKAM